MTLQEYYNFPEGVVPQMTGIPHWLEDKPNFPCPANMSFAFTYSQIAVVPPLDVSNVTTMQSMFNNCQKLTSLDLSGWDTSKVTDMMSMFYYCSNLSSLDGLDNLDTRNVTNMGDMFSFCSKLTSLSSLRADSLTISPWQSPFGNSNYTLVDFGGFINLKSSWDGSYGVNTLTALSHQSLINILNGLYDFTGNGETPTSSQGKLKLGSTHLAALSDDEKAIATNKGWVLS